MCAWKYRRPLFRQASTLTFVQSNSLRSAYVRVKHYRRALSATFGGANYTLFIGTQGKTNAIITRTLYQDPPCPSRLVALAECFDRRRREAPVCIRGIVDQYRRGPNFQVRW